MLAGVTAYLAKSMICDEDGNVLFADEPGLDRLTVLEPPWEGPLELRLEGVSLPPASLEVTVVDARGELVFSSGQPILLPPVPGNVRTNFTLQNVFLPHYGVYELRIASNGQLAKSLPLRLDRELEGPMLAIEPPKS